MERELAVEVESRVQVSGAVLRQQRNRTERPLSPHKFIERTVNAEQIPQNNFRMLEEDIRSSQKGSPLSSKGGRAKYTREKERQMR